MTSNLEPRARNPPAPKRPGDANQHLSASKPEARTGEAPVRPIDRIVLPVEGTDREFDAQRWAVELAAGLRVAILAVHVSNRVAGGAPRADVFAYLQGECRKWAVPLETRTLRGNDVVQELVDELGVRDLVVLGTRRLASDYHVGSVAGGLVRRAPCPVQLVRLP